MQAEPQNDVKITCEHKHGGAKPSSASTIEGPGSQFGMGDKVTWEYAFANSTFTKKMSHDCYEDNGTKVVNDVSYEFTPANSAMVYQGVHQVNFESKVETGDLGGCKAGWKGELDCAYENGEKAKPKFDVKSNINLEGDEWNFGVNGELLQESKEFGVQATFNMHKNCMLYGKLAGALPMTAHPVATVGAAYKWQDWKNVLQV